MIEIKGAPFPASLNSKYGQINGRLILSKEYRQYKANLNLFLIHKYRDLKKNDLKDKPLLVTVEYCGSKISWFTKSGQIRKKDCDNYQKSLFDVVFPFLGLDDSQIFDLRIKKVINEGQTITVNLTIDELKS